ncbi:MAG: alpha/beta hydrolase [Lentisphaerae bacterium]|nr:alpha/beta hydrolase [Lentisphaerota bacterium]
MVRLDLDADANYDGQWNIADEYLEDNPGVMVLLNDDDDNNNKIMDKDDPGTVENEDDLRKITLAFAPASLSGATLKLEATTGSDNIKIWTAADRSGEPVNLPKIYRPGTGTASGGDESVSPLPSTLYVEGIAEGTAKLKLSFVNDETIFDEITLHVVKIGLLPDFNRDRKINDEDQSLLITKGPFRFWINDDKDEGNFTEGKKQDSSNVPGSSSPNHGDSKVNGRCDLLDFFPVWVNVKKLMEKQPPGVTFQFRLRQDDSALKIVYTTLSSGNAGEFQTTHCASCGPTLSQSSEVATTTAIAPSAVFPECFVEQLETGNGIVMAEGAAASDSPLILEVRNGDHVAFERKMPMKLSGVEAMFRLVSLRDLSAPGISLPSEPANLPDEVTDNANIFFLHGFRVTLGGARAWNSEMFKRLWQSASNSRYWGVTWKGDAGINTAFNYHKNVYNAFLTANKLKTLINDSGISGTKTVMAHSLGNMVVCSAIKDHQLVVSKYCMLNAAVPSEAFGSANISASSKSVLHHIEWDDYKEKTWSTEWHMYFPNDERNNLTWINRFRNIGGNIVNFYSNEDEVLMLHSSNDIWAGTGASWWEITEYGNHSWHKQEAFKGRAYNNPFYLACTDWCGWGFAMEWDDDGDLVRKYDAAAANAMPTDVLAVSPVFHLNPPEMMSLPNLLPLEDRQKLLNELLAKGIPALSPPCGAGDINGLAGKNMTDFKSNGWGRPKNEWLHSDIKNMAFYYTYLLFDELLGKKKD